MRVLLDNRKKNVLISGLTKMNLLERWLPFVSSDVLNMVCLAFQSSKGYDNYNGRKDNMKYLTEVHLDGTQDGGEVGRIMITTADGSIFFIQEEFGSKRLIIDS